jgi:hypothetical protein
MEACFSQLTLDVIGKAVFNYDFDSLTTSSPVIQARITLLVVQLSPGGRSAQPMDVGSAMGSFN